MSDTRKEEARRARELHLLRDERDLEVEAEGSRKAGSAVLTASQLLAVLCVLQENPAWTALLSLSFVAGAVRAFHQFASDREGLYLLLGLAASAAALALCGWFFLDFWPEWLSAGRLLGLAVLFEVSRAVAALCFVGLTLGAFWLKKKVHHMDGEKWEAYFQNLPTTALLMRLGVLLAVSLLVAAALSYFLLAGLSFPTPVRLAAVFCVGNGVLLSRKMSERREALVGKLLRVKRTET